MRALAIGTTGVNMKPLSAQLENCHKERGRGLGLYFVEELKKEVDWVIFLDSDDYFWQESMERGRGEGHSEGRGGGG